MSSLFDHNQIRLDLLRQRAFNQRWASFPDDVIPLTAADPDFPCAPEITEAIEKYSRDRYFSYAPPEGYTFFREAMANHYQENRNVNITPSGVLACDSAAFGIQIVCRAFLQAGDEAIILDPVDFLFRYCVEAQSAKAIPWRIDVNPEKTPDLSLLESIISSKTRMICLCNPVNPTGRIFSREELKKITGIAERHKLMILSDEIWSDIIFPNNTYCSIASLPGAALRTIIVTGFSKSYGLAGLRAGAILTANEVYWKRLMEASEHQNTIHGCGVLPQVAASAALTKAKYWLDGFLLHLTRMRNLSVEFLNGLPGIHCHKPQACFVAFPDITGTGMDASQLQVVLLNDAKVAIVPGLPRWFGEGAAGHIRISFATSEDILTEAFSRIKKVLVK